MCQIPKCAQNYPVVRIKKSYPVQILSKEEWFSRNFVLVLNIRPEFGFPGCAICAQTKCVEFVFLR